MHPFSITDRDKEIVLGTWQTHELVIRRNAAIVADRAGTHRTELFFKDYRLLRQTELGPRLKGLREWIFVAAAFLVIGAQCYSVWSTRGAFVVAAAFAVFAYVFGLKNPPRLQWQSRQTLRDYVLYLETRAQAHALDVELATAMNLPIERTDSWEWDAEPKVSRLRFVLAAVVALYGIASIVDDSTLMLYGTRERIVESDIEYDPNGPGVKYSLVTTTSGAVCRRMYRRLRSGNNVRVAWYSLGSVRLERCTDSDGIPMLSLLWGLLVSYVGAVSLSWLFPDRSRPLAPHPLVVAALSVERKPYVVETPPLQKNRKKKKRR